MYSKELQQQGARYAESHKVGVIHSLGALRDNGAVPLLAGLLNGSDFQAAGAAAAALGKIGTPDAGVVLERCFSEGTEEIRQAVIDALLQTADRLFVEGKLDVAARVFQNLESADAEHVRAAAVRGLVASRPAAVGTFPSAF
jgi:HEAT repeat protein